MQEKKSPKNLRIRKVCIVGVIPSFAFQRAKYCALELHRKLPQRFPLPEIVGLLELDWSEKLQEWRQMLGREYWCLRRPVAVFFDNRFIGSDIELIKLTTISNILMDNIPRKDMSYLKQSFRKDYMSYLKKSKRIYCYLDICIDDVYAGTLTFLLYSDLLPRTCENFKTLCVGTRGPLLTYKGSRIHRIVKKGWLQGGDVQYKTGGGGFSIFCDPLEDECFGISHDKRGVLSMANAGRHKNGSQFFITLQPSRWMDTHFVAFGQLIEGVKVLRTLENLETMYESPISKVEIKSCGKLDLGDVEDIDTLYKEEAMPPKKPKRIETIGNQVTRMIMEALTEALKRKAHPPDILDDGDVPSKMNLQLYFQGFYSLPKHILEKTADYLRKFRRELFRLIKPSATEIVESLMYDLQMAVFTRMTNLDDMRETIGRDLYNRMIRNIELTMEGCRKSYVRRLINQIVQTAENMVELVTKKVLMMKKQSTNLKNFQDRMQNWVKSFVLQETFEGDNYFIAERPFYPVKEEEKLMEGDVCCEQESRKKEEELKAKLRAKYTPEDLCCLGSQLHLSDSVINFEDYFKECRYDLKRLRKKEQRMPLLDLIEISRYKLRRLRKQEHRQRPSEMFCTEKNIRKWMAEVSYTSETEWLKDSVYPRDCRVLDHVEEIMYGAMTAGLLEMYYFVDEYLKTCGEKKKMLVTRTIYPSEESFESESLSDTGTDTQQSFREQKYRGRVKLPEERERDDEEDGEIEEAGEWGQGGGVIRRKKKKGADRGGGAVGCPCGHPCCDCPFDPNAKKLEDKKKKKKKKGGSRGKGDGDDEDEDEDSDEDVEDEESEEKEESKEGARTGLTYSEAEQPPEPPPKPCASDETAVDLNVVLAEKLSASPDEIDVNSFNWLKKYIRQKGCDLKSMFASRVHNWMEGERFCVTGLLSKHSLVTRASLLSLSLSLAELIKEENNIKTEVRDFIYDLWDLYFEEMFKEATLEFPPEEDKEKERGRKGEGGGLHHGDGDKDEEDNAEDGGVGEGKGKGKGKSKSGVGGGDGGKDEDESDDDETKEEKECRKLQEMFKDFDFEKYCSKIQNEEEEADFQKLLTEKFQSPQPKQVKEVTPSATPRRTGPSGGSTPVKTRSRPSMPRRVQSSKISVTRQAQASKTSMSHRSQQSKTSMSRRAQASKTSMSRRSEHSKTSMSRRAHASKTSMSRRSQHSKTSVRQNAQKSEQSYDYNIPEEYRKPRDSEMTHGYSKDETSSLGQGQKRISSSESSEYSSSDESQVDTSTQKGKKGREASKGKDRTKERKKKATKRRKSPIVIQELVDVPSREEVRKMPPYVLPFWVKFLTEMTKQALGAFARVSRLPRRLYLKSDSELAFDDRMKAWFEFNAFNPQPTKGREVMDFIALHQKSLVDLEDTARTFLKKKKYSKLIDRCTRFSSADDVARDIIYDAIQLSHEAAKANAEEEDETLELFVSNMLSSAVASSKAKSQSSIEGEEEGNYTMPTDDKETNDLEAEGDA